MRTKGWKRFSATVESLIEGFKSGEIVVQNDGNAENESAALQVVEDGSKKVAELLSRSELVGAELAVSASALALSIARQALRLLFPNKDVIASLWTLMPHDPEWLVAHHIDGLPTDGIESMCFGKMPLDGSPCGDAIRTGHVVYAQMPQSPQSIYREFSKTMKWCVGSLVAWPVTWSGACVAVLLFESNEPKLLASDASTNRVLDVIGSLFERIFEAAVSRGGNVSQGNKKGAVLINQHLPKD